MRGRRRRGIVFSGGTLFVFSVFLITIGIVLGLMFSSLLNMREPAGILDMGTPKSGGTITSAENPKETPVAESPGADALPEAYPADADDFEESEAVVTNEEKVAEYVASLSLREKVCQMMIVSPDTITGVSGTTVAGSVTKVALEKYPVGGLIHFSPNITSSEQISLFNSTVQTYVKTPMFISVDEEGGRVARLRASIGAHSVGAMLSYENDGGEVAADNAKTLSDVLKRYNFNTNYSPVADVWSNPENTVIGDRSYSTDFDTAADLVAAAVRGFNESSVVCSLKHFPGHGDTKGDSHNGAVYLNKTLAELRDNEFKPFAAGISGGADMVMTGHLIVTAEDKLPASLSHRLITDVLRGELGFSGVVITDSLAMGAISSLYDADFVAVTAVKAGVDILLMPNGIDKTIAALMSAVESGDISETRIDESVMRIIALKAKRGIIEL